MPDETPAPETVPVQEPVPEPVPAPEPVPETPDVPPRASRKQPATTPVHMTQGGTTVSTPTGFVAVPEGDSDQPQEVVDALVAAGLVLA